MRSIYHIREFNVHHLSLPQYIERHSDTQSLLRHKPFFRQDVQTGNLGSPPLMGLLRTLKPKWWFSAHLHVRFQATPSVTNFLALDKCLPKREFMEICSSVGGTRSWTFDPEWLAMSRAFHPFFSTRRRQADYPDEATARAKVAEEMEWVKPNVHNNEANSSDAPLPGIRSILDCQTFVQSAPGPGSEGAQKNQQPPWYTNPQTTAFCDMLNIQNMIDFSSDNRA
ncbi:hypothetical protein BDR05DRAFT_981491 [Suillus weaverae]|nr:hypothetical protein BDR05DRAFT_981491 [Suillus weaverae]